MPFQAMRLGDALLLGLPWEVTTQAGRRIRAQAADASGAETVAVVGLTNDYGGYLTTPEEYTAQGDEGQMTWWGPEQAEWVADNTVRPWCSAGRAGTRLSTRRGSARSSRWSDVVARCSGSRS